MSADTTSLGLALLSGLLASAAPIAFQKQGGEPDRQLSLQFWSNLIQTAIAGCAILVLGLKFGGGAYVGICVASSLFMTVNNYAYYSIAAHRGPVSISWAVVYMASVLVAAMGWVFLGEPLRLYQPPGVLCFLGCLGLMAWASHLTAKKRGKVQAPRRGYWPAISIALAAGAIGSFGMKFKNLVGDVGHDMTYILMRCGVLAAVIGAVLAFRRLRPLTDRRTMICACVSAVVFTGAFVLLLRALNSAEASVIFPVQAGAAMIFGVLWAVLRGERPSRLAYLGVILAIASIVLISLGGEELLANAPK